MKNLSKISMILLGMSLCFTQCKKAEKGPKGDKGDPGAVGNANVVTTNTVELKSWSYDSTGDIYTTSITSPALTQSVMDNGLVMVYIKDDGWIPLPYVGLSSPTDFLTFQILPGSVLISYFDNVDPTENPNSFGIVVKVVIIPKAAAKPAVNHEDYSQVKQSYSLTE
jgi:hypothetical protein